MHDVFFNLHTGAKMQLSRYKQCKNALVMYISLISISILIGSDREVLFEKLGFCVALLGFQTRESTAP